MCLRPESRANQNAKPRSTFPKSEHPQTIRDELLVTTSDLQTVEQSSHSDQVIPTDKMASEYYILLVQKIEI